MRQDFFEYVPQFKLMVAGNHKPGLRSVNEAIRRRLKLIPFTVTIPEQERDEKLSESLKAEWPGILQWMIDGCLAWQRDGLAPPDIVRSATHANPKASPALTHTFKLKMPFRYGSRKHANPEASPALTRCSHPGKPGPNAQANTPAAGNGCRERLDGLLRSSKGRLLRGFSGLSLRSVPEQGGPLRIDDKCRVLPHLPLHLLIDVTRTRTVEPEQVANLAEEPGGHQQVQPGSKKGTSAASDLAGSIDDHGDLRGLEQYGALEERPAVAVGQLCQSPPAGPHARPHFGM